VINPPYAHTMARYVIDAPTLLHLVDSDLRIDPSHQLVAPNSIRSEALQLLLRDVRRGTRTEKAAVASHERVTELKMRLLGDRASRGTAWRIAREHDWDTLRDAEYLAIARLQADALVTVDPDLAAKAQNVVPVAAIEALLTSE
jgi:predicted nucleic acid-binding protein